MKGALVYILLVFIGFTNYLSAQKKVNVITKTITREFNYSNETLVINAEKSNINIHQGEGNKVKVQIDLIAKNPSKSDAENDMDIMQYYISQSEGAINLSNFFKSDRMVEITSNLSAAYDIYIPLACNVDIKNLYGQINMNDAQVSGEIDNSFGSVSLQNITGNLHINLSFSDLASSNTDGELKIDAKNANLSMKNLSGKNTVNTTYGEIEIKSLHELKVLDVDAKRCSVNLNVDQFENYNYNLGAYKKEIILPEKYSSKIIKDSSSNLFSQQYNSNNSLIKIKSTYCPITIQ